MTIPQNHPKLPTTIHVNDTNGLGSPNFNAPRLPDHRPCNVHMASVPTAAPKECPVM